MQGGGGNPFAALGNMGNIMENVKKAQQLVQVEAAKAQEELAAYVSPALWQRTHGSPASASALLVSLLNIVNPGAGPDLKATAMTKQCGL